MITDETRIGRLAFEVHNTLGYGFLRKAISAQRTVELKCVEIKTNYLTICVSSVIILG